MSVLKILKVTFNPTVKFVRKPSLDPSKCNRKLKKDRDDLWIF